MESVNKYVTFKRDEFLRWLEEDVQPMAAAEFMPDEIPDAVVIRRQDLFAAPALATYADCIGLVSKTTDDKELQKRLLKVADFFQDQAKLAADEGYKWPD